MRREIHYSKIGMAVDGRNPANPVQPNLAPFRSTLFRARLHHQKLFLVRPCLGGQRLRQKLRPIRQHHIQPIPLQTRNLQVIVQITIQRLITTHYLSPPSSTAGPSNRLLHDSTSRDSIRCFTSFCHDGGSFSCCNACSASIFMVSSYSR